MSIAKYVAKLCDHLKHKGKETKQSITDKLASGNKSTSSYHLSY